VRTDLSELHARLRIDVIIFVSVLTLASLVAYLLASRLQRVVSEPVRHLVEIAHTVSTGNDYSIRARKFANDEIGQLIDGFNNMLEQVHQRDVALEEHRTQLEQQVVERTRQLTNLNADLISAVERAEAGSRAKSAFLANMSHEIRTPMTAILGYADMLLDPHRTVSDRHDSLQVIRRNARHLMDLINDVLDVSKIEAEKMSVEKITFELPQIIADVVSMVRPRAIDKGLGFHLNFSSLIPATVQGDPVRLKQVLLNILGNALKFTERGVISLSVGCEPLPRGSRLRFDVNDTGVGLAPDQIQRLFKPFMQADDSTTRKFGGTGLGLVISKKLVQLMGGDITVVSQPGRGSTFTIQIEDGPLDGAEMLAGLSESLLSGHQETKDSQETKLRGRILLAEDGQDNQCLISMLLREAGAEVVLAENGRIAVELATTQQFDLILMDMQMPELDGYGATSALRSKGHTLPIIALTAHAMADDRAKCIAAGCSDYCTKPIEKARLLRVARHYLEKSASEQSPISSASATPVPAAPPVMIRSNALQTGGMAQAVRDFVGRLPNRVRSLREQLDAEGLDDLRRTLHQLKGAGTGYGFPQITEIAAHAEHAIKSSQSLEQIRQQVEELIGLISRVEGYSEEETPCDIRS
jgi:signal transduction histidine kinase/HPt (histidine-containing phosphotransfer) domain-containing protein/ActR/RegA family two-component response regulator